MIRSTKDLEQLRENEVLVTEMTDPDWEPVMRRAAAIVTDRGGRTCHAAIVSRELGIPAVVGTERATAEVPDGEDVTVSCAEGEEGRIYRGLLKTHVERTNLSAMERPHTRIMLNVGNPAEAFSLSLLPTDGVGLARLERELMTLEKQWADGAYALRVLISGCGRMRQDGSMPSALVARLRAADQRSCEQERSRQRPKQVWTPSQWKSATPPPVL